MMKNRKYILAILCLLFLMGCGTSETENTKERTVGTDIPLGKAGLEIEKGDLKESGVDFVDGPVDFQDAVMEEMLRNMLGKPEGEILRSDLQEIHGIYWRYDRYWSNLQSADGRFPEDEFWTLKEFPKTLQDLIFCDNLQWLGIGGMKVESIKELAALPQLETMEFAGATVAENVPEELALFSQLKRLEIGSEDNWGDITDGDFLLPLAEQLISLQATEDVKWNPKVIAQMTKLEQLFIGNVDDLSFLESMPELQDLCLYCCTAEDWSAIASLKKLKELRLLGNMYVTIDVSLEDIQSLSQLEYMTLIFTKVQSENSRQEIIDAFPNLKGLQIF